MTITIKRNITWNGWLELPVGTVLTIWKVLSYEGGNPYGIFVLVDEFRDIIYLSRGDYNLNP